MKNTASANGGSLHSGVQGRANPKRLTELAEMLAELRDWTWLEAKIETEKSKQEIWLQVRDWAVGAASQKKLNLDSVPVALKQHTANAGMESLNKKLTDAGPKTPGLA